MERVSRDACRRHLQQQGGTWRRSRRGKSDQDRHRVTSPTCRAKKMIQVPFFTRQNQTPGHWKQTCSHPRGRGGLMRSLGLPETHPIPQTDQQGPTAQHREPQSPSCKEVQRKRTREKTHMHNWTPSLHARNYSALATTRTAIQTNFYEGA